MRNMLALVGLLVVGFGGAGWYFGWYKLEVSRNADGTLKVTTNVDTNQLTKDAATGAKRVEDLIHTQVEKAAQNAPAAPAATPAPAAVPAPAEAASWLFGVEAPAKK